jgi:hypothetical protein
MAVFLKSHENIVAPSARNQGSPRRPSGSQPVRPEAPKEKIKPRPAFSFKTHEK